MLCPSSLNLNLGSYLPWPITRTVSRRTTGDQVRRPPSRLRPQKSSFTCHSINTKFLSYFFKKRSIVSQLTGRLYRRERTDKVLVCSGDNATHATGCDIWVGDLCPNLWPRLTTWWAKLRETLKAPATCKPWRSKERVCGAPRSQLPLVLTYPDLALTNCPNMGTVIK